MAVGCDFDLLRAIAMMITTMVREALLARPLTGYELVTRVRAGASVVVFVSCDKGPAEQATVNIRPDGCPGQASGYACSSASFVPSPGPKCSNVRFRMEWGSVPPRCTAEDEWLLTKNVSAVRP